MHFQAGKSHLMFCLCCRDGSTKESYNSLPLEAKFANFLGILIVVFGMVLLRILSKEEWRRPETDESAYVSWFKP